MVIDIGNEYGSVRADVDCDEYGIYSVMLIERERRGKMVCINDASKKLSQRTLDRKLDLIYDCIEEAENG